jgi:phytoene/squalene synthetase
LWDDGAAELLGDAPADARPLMTQGLMTQGNATQPELSAMLAIHVARVDPHRWDAARLAPRRARFGLAVLYAFNYEIARIREVVREPMLGAIRLHWWRETLAEIFEADTRPAQLRRRHELAAPLAEVIRDAKLERPAFDALIDAREKDLEPAPFPTLADFTSYAERSSAGLIGLAAQVLAPGSIFDGQARAAMREAGLAWALTGILRSASVWASQGRNLTPAEFAHDQGLRHEDVAPGAPGFATAAGRLAAIAATHHRLARRLGAALPSRALPALAYVALTPGLLRQPQGLGAFARWASLMGAVVRGRV